ncbi:MAG: hypothetical protein H0T76_21990 [Nannocystis sp.]|nr:CARDB domain-containing protein [Nannocystis sp.]MBA3549152.1 hypothetical protein [Nannocystis sp.]
MKTYLARYWAVYGISLVAPALAACSDDGSPGSASETEASSGTSGTTAGGTTVVPTTGGDTITVGSVTDSGSTSTGPDPSTSSSTGDSTTGEVSATSTAGSTTTGGDLCVTILCGDPAVCCTDAEECVDGKCLDVCPSGIRCGEDQEICCAGGDVCVGSACATPGGDCNDSYDCPPGNYCEPVLGKCLKQPDPLLCEVVPTFDGVEVQLEWAFTKDQVIAMPVVANVTGDETPEVIVNTTRVQGGNDTDYVSGEIICLDGKTGTELWRIKHDPANKKFGAHGRATIAVGDVSGDGKPDIVYAGLQEGATKVSPVHAVDGDGNLLWTSRMPNNAVAKIRIENGTATLANLDADPQAEIAFGAALFDHDGLLVHNQGNNGGMVGTPHNKMQPTAYIYPGGMATFADLDGDKYPELVTGREAWTINWMAGNPPTVNLVQKWKDVTGSGGDGWTAIGDLDNNGTPEVVLTAWPDIKILDGATGKLWCGVDPTGVMCNNNDALRTQPILVFGGNLGGPATISDFDGDGRAEIGIATGVDYRVYDLNRPGEVIVKPPADPAPIAGAMFTRWAAKAQDKSSAATGSSVFDFQGDGAAEVAYQDECFARIYDGATGKVLRAVANSSATIHEYPLVADLDGDGNSEFLVVANQSDLAARNLCVAANPGWVPRQGVFSYGAGADNWVPTRKVWTQHTYHVTNAESDGNVPMMEQDNWTSPGLNNFRQNVQGAGVFNTADLSVSLAIGLNDCGDNKLELQATIYNEGALGVPAGINVTFYEGIDNTGTKLAIKPTTQPILTGGSTKVSYTVDGPPAPMTTNYFVEVDDDNIIQECLEDNNGAVVTDAKCPIPG